MWNGRCSGRRLASVGWARVDRIVASLPFPLLARPPHSSFDNERASERTQEGASPTTAITHTRPTHRNMTTDTATAPESSFRLYVGNLSYATDEAALRKALTAAGCADQLESATISMRPVHGRRRGEDAAGEDVEEASGEKEMRSRGYGFVQFASKVMWLGRCRGCASFLVNFYFLFSLSLLLLVCFYA